MSAEYLTAAASLVTVVVIAATAVAALIQLRHMRSANTLNAMLGLRQIFNDPLFVKATNALRGYTVAAALEDPGFRRLLEREAAETDEYHRSLYESTILVLNWYEAFGALVRQGVLSMRDIGDNYASVIDLHWRWTEPATTHIRRHYADDAFYEMFEYLTDQSRAWMEAHPSVYPANVPRILPLHGHEPQDAAR